MHHRGEADKWQPTRFLRMKWSSADEAQLGVKIGACDGAGGVGSLHHPDGTPNVDASDAMRACLLVRSVRLQGRAGGPGEAAQLEDRGAQQAHGGNQFGISLQSW